MSWVIKTHTCMVARAHTHTLAHTHARMHWHTHTHSAEKDIQMPKWRKKKKRQDILVLKKVEKLWLRDGRFPRTRQRYGFPAADAAVAGYIANHWQSFKSHSLTNCRLEPRLSRVVGWQSTISRMICCRYWYCRAIILSYSQCQWSGTATGPSEQSLPWLTFHRRLSRNGWLVVTSPFTVRKTFKNGSHRCLKKTF